jgi:metal-sulfur cluster biosynthetic enzyme
MGHPSGLMPWRFLVRTVVDEGIFPNPMDLHTICVAAEHIRHLNDPEHPLTLEQLNVASLDGVSVSDVDSSIDIFFTPTIPHCSMATLIGLCIRVKLLRTLPPRFKVTVKVTPGSHAQEGSVNKQLNDKERVAAALENGALLDMVNKCIAHTDRVEEVFA